VIDDLLARVTFDPDRGETGPDTLNKVSPIPFCLEAKKVVVQKSVNNLGSPWKSHKEIPWREGDMQEKGFFRRDTRFLKVFGKEQKLIIMDPDEIPRLDLCLDSVGELAVDLTVGVPVLTAETAVAQQIMKQGPEGFIAKTVVVFRDLPMGQGDGLEPISGAC
jgi:hypothetical protein